MRQACGAAPFNAESSGIGPRGAGHRTHGMTEPTTFTRGFSIALLAFLDAVAPPVVAVGLLYGLCFLYGIEFKGFFVVLTILTAMLSLLLLRGCSVGSGQLVKSTVPLAMGVIMRWMIIIAILL